MQDESLNHLDFNAQTQRLRDTVQQGECLTTRRAERLAQVFLCEGCCCGRADKGFPPLPKAMMKETWKSLKLNATIQLTISGCLGPCDVANVVYLLASDGTGLWFGGLTEEWQYETLIAWAVECRQAVSCCRFRRHWTATVFHVSIPFRLPLRHDRWAPNRHCACAT